MMKLKVAFRNFADGPKNCNDTIGNRTRNLPACSAVPVKLPANIKLILHKAINTSMPALPGNLCKNPPFDIAAPAKGGSSHKWQLFRVHTHQQFARNFRTFTISPQNDVGSIRKSYTIKKIKTFAALDEAQRAIFKRQKLAGGIADDRSTNS
jgi:hypothetical protein